MYVIVHLHCQKTNVLHIMTLSKLIAIIKMGRPYFSGMAVLPYLIGVAYAAQPIEALDMRLLWGGLVVQVLVQLSVSYLNDYWDIETDTLNQNRTLFSGGSGELQTGIVSPSTAMVIGLVLQGPCSAGGDCVRYWLAELANTWVGDCIGTFLYHAACEIGLSGLG